MRVIPAIDILDGRCVRLQEGDYGRVTVYRDSPVEMAAVFFDMGVVDLHVVDLDAAKAGRPVNGEIVEGILSLAGRFGAGVQVGGGLRCAESVGWVLGAGARCAILGTSAVRDADFRGRMIDEYPGRVVVGMDCREGWLAVEGWRVEERVSGEDFLRTLGERPPAAVVYTDVSRDGTLSGVNVEATGRMASLAPCPVIASGGVRGVEDVRALRDCGNVAGVVVGRAVYTGDLDLMAVLEEVA